MLRHRLGRLHTEGDEIRGLIDATLASGVPELFLVEEQYRLALLAAEIAFCEEFTGKITDPDTGWGPMWAEYHGETAPPTVGA